jgi:hypothetical protein
MAIAKFAEALLIIPKTLATNAAKDATDLVARLRAMHYAHQSSVDEQAQSLKWSGLDLLRGEIRNNLKAGVLEPALIKLKSLKAATEARDCGTLATYLAAQALKAEAKGDGTFVDWSEGDAQWYEKIARPVVAVETAVPLAAADEPVSPAARAVRRPARTPSEPVGHAVDGARLFDLKDVRATAAEHGVAVHAALAEIEWAGEIAQRRAVEWGKAGGPRAEAAACVHAAELAEVWTRPGASGGAAVWRERPFEIVLDGEWISGVVDRVVLERGVDGRARRATVYDFKTDRVEPGADLHAAAARHAAQCEIYRRVVATLAQLAPAAVGCEVVFTRVRRRVAMGH